MCGICGIMNVDGSPVDPAVLHAMTALMRHRGPDGEGYFIDGNMGLGFRRLAIVDVKHGHQPMSNETGSVWVAFNGEIYNYMALRRELMDRGHIFRTESDTEVIVHLYEDRGADFVHQLQGMFAVAIVDLKRREMLLARDHFGIKPLYYARTGGGLQFASELRSLLSAQQSNGSVNPQTMWDFCTFQYIPTPETLFHGIQKLPPAHYLRFRNGQLSLHAYWTPSFDPEAGKPLSYYVEGIEFHLRNAVRRHLQGDVSIGAFLSSGVDSSAIAALMREEGSVTTFSIGFEGASDELDELKQAEETAAYLGVRHCYTTVTAKQVRDCLPSVLYSLEEPLGDPSAIALYLVSELASHFVTVVLSGEGADEVFGGYPIYHEPKSLRLFDYLPRSAKKVLSQWALRWPQGMKGRGFVLRGATPLERRFIGNIKVFSEDAKHLLFSSKVMPFQPLSSFRFTDPVYERTHGVDPITQMQLIDLACWMPGDILLKADKMTMAHSLELRVPFLDLELFEFARRIPVQYRVGRVQGKVALREAVSRWLPTSVTRRPKLGFPVPYRKWLREAEMADFAWDVFRSGSLRSWFRTEELERMLHAHRTGERDYGRELWTLLTLFLWHKVFEQPASMNQSASGGIR